MARLRLLAANYNQHVMWVYQALEAWLAERQIDFALVQCESEAELIEKAEQADILLAFKIPVTERVLAALPRLKLVMSSGNGYEHIDVEAATRHGVVVTNAAEYSVEDVAEHALTLILACARKLRQLEILSRQGKWQVGALVQPTHRFGTQTVGLIGLGKIGRALAWRLKVLGFGVLASDPQIGADTVREIGVEPAPLEKLLREADFVSVHTPLTQTTRRFLGAEALRLMKPGAWLINTGRGGVVDEAALLAALREKRLAGAALDVLETEPPHRDNPLLRMDNVIITGHAAGTSVEGVRDWQQEWRTIIEGFATGGWPINVLNPEVEPRAPLGRHPARPC